LRQYFPKVTTLTDHSQAKRDSSITQAKAEKAAQYESPLIDLLLVLQRSVELTVINGGSSAKPIDIR
jgi:hypothetical protein